MLFPSAWSGLFQFPSSTYLPGHLRLLLQCCMPPPAASGHSVIACGLSQPAARPPDEPAFNPWVLSSWLMRIQECGDA